MRGERGGAIPRAPSHYGGAKRLQGAPKSPNNVTSAFFNTVNLLPNNLRFEHGGAKLASCPGRHLASLRPWVGHSIRVSTEIGYEITESDAVFPTYHSKEADPLTLSCVRQQKVPLSTGLVDSWLINQSLLFSRNTLPPEMEALLNRTTFLVITAFLLLWFPYHLYRLIAVSRFEGIFRCWPRIFKINVCAVAPNRCKVYISCETLKFIEIFSLIKITQQKLTSHVNLSSFQRGFSAKGCHLNV